MFKKLCAKTSSFLIFSMWLTSIVLPFPTNASGRNLRYLESSASLETSVGLKTAVFNTDSGVVRFNLPNDLARGDIISGSLSINLAGKSEADRQKNLKAMNGFVITIDDNRISPTSNYAKFEIPRTLKNDGLIVTLRESAGKALAHIDIPVNPAAETSPPPGYDIPAIGQTGRGLEIGGNFDGDLSNTTCMIGVSPAKAMAESPRKAVFLSPTDVVGPAELKFTEGNTEITSDFRNVGVNLSASKLNLLRGETTDLTVSVEGLQGIEDPLPLNLSCSGSATMQGGNIQNLQINPEDVQPNGSYSQNRVLTGNTAGIFNVSATVLADSQPKGLNGQIVHVERDPVLISREGDPEQVWWVKVKTLDGRLIDIYFKQNFKPNLQFCNWIKITESGSDEINDNIVKNYELVDDPNKPCELTNQTVHVEGDPLGLPGGRWQVKIKTADGRILYIYLRSPSKPDLKFCNWITLRSCRKLSANSFEVEGYDIAEDPNKKPPATTVMPTPTPTPTPVPPPVAVVKPECPTITIRNRKKVVRTFEILDEESTLALEIETNAGGGGAAAEGMAGWLQGVGKIGDKLSGHIPEEAVVGGAVAGAVLKYVELGGEIIGALAKSRLRNLNVNRVTGKLTGKATKVTATCITYEICRDGRWTRVAEYSEERETVEINLEVTIRADGSNPIDNNWKNVTVTSKPQFFDPDKAEKWLMEYFLQIFKKNEDGYGEFKDGCK